jgi:hypothetical protein
MRHQPIDIERGKANIICCGCGEVGTSERMHMLLLGFQAPENYRGWGCFVCQLPARGAQALLCPKCKGKTSADELQTICGGAYAISGDRVPLQGYERIPFGHLPGKHPEVASQ